MSHGSIALVVGMLLAGPALGQVTVQVTLEQDQVLPGESVRLAVRITNFSGQTLHLGRDLDWLRFTIETPEARLIPSRADLAVAGEFDLPSSKVAVKRVDLAPGYDLTRPGRYLISASVRVDEWNTDLTSRPVDLSVIRGSTLWEQQFGVPPPPDASGPPEVRQYALIQAVHLRKMKLYVRVSSPALDRVYAVFPLGPLLTFSTPERQIDRHSHLHVLYQDGARTFNYSVINPDGELVVRQTHEYSTTRPILAIDANGDITVNGGMRRPAPTDLPRPPEPAVAAPPTTPPAESDPPPTVD